MAVSNASKAVQFAAQHLADTEARLEEANQKMAQLENELSQAQGRLQEQANRIAYLEKEKSAWFYRATSLAQSIMSASKVLIQGSEVIHDINLEAFDEGNKDRSPQARLPKVGDGEALDIQRS